MKYLRNCGLFHPDRLVGVEGEALGLADPFLLFGLDVLAGVLEGYVAFEVGLQDGVGELAPEFRGDFELGIAAQEIVHKLKGVEQGMIFRSGLEHNLVAIATLAGVAAGGRLEGAGT